MDTPAPPVTVEWIGTNEAAELIGCSPRTINLMVLKGELVGHKRNPNRANSPLRISRASVEGFIRARDGAEVPNAQRPQPPV